MPSLPGNKRRYLYYLSAMRQAIHVLHISATKTWGGGENHLLNLCEELRSEPGVKNTILCSEDGKLHEKLRTLEFSFVTAPLAYKIDLRYFLKIGRFCRENQIDLIHIHDSTALSLTVTGDQLFDLPPMILSKKTSFPIRDRRQTRFKYNYKKIRSILCVSEKTREITALKVDDQEKLKVIYHGTRFREKTPSSPIDLRETFKLAPGVTIVGNIANHTKVKNLESFLQVADILVNRQGKKEFFFVQAGAFSKVTSTLKTLVREKNLAAHVAFLDFVPEASRLLPQFDISLVTSENEGIPQFIYESFFYQVPVVSTNVGGISEIIAHGENGLLAEKNDNLSLAQNLTNLTENRQLQDRFRHRSKSLVMKKFGTRTMAEQTLEEYKKIVYGEY